MLLHSYAHSSVPIFWNCRPGIGDQPHADRCQGFPPIAGFIVVYLGTDYEVFGLDVTTEGPPDPVFAHAVYCPVEESAVVAPAVFMEVRSEGIAGTFVETEMVPEVILSESIEMVMNWQATGIISVCVVCVVPKEAVMGTGVFDDDC